MIHFHHAGLLALTLVGVACMAEKSPGPGPANPPAAVRKQDAGISKDAGPTAKVAPPAWDPVFESRDYPTRLPVVWIEVEGSHFDIKPDTKSRGRLKLIEDHNGTHMGLKNSPATLDTTIGISVRGSSSAGFPQKSYSVEIQKASGVATKAPILDLPSGEDWNLVTCWGDKTCMRNALGLWMGRQFGRWSARTRFVEVYLNSRYNGIYLLTEAIKPDRNKIDIAKPAPTADEGDITGGYIFRREAGGKAGPTAKPPQDWLSPYKPTAIAPYTKKVQLPMVYTYHVPNSTTITDDQRAYLSKYMAEFEAMMDGPNWKDPKNGYRTWIDVKSWLEYALHGEVSNDIDHYFKSVYWVKESAALGGKLFQTPMWDFDRVFGNAGYRDGFKVDNWVNKMNPRYGGECSDWIPNQEGCMACAYDNACVPTPEKLCFECSEIPYVPYYWEKLWTDPAFLDDMKCRWQELHKTAYNPVAVESRIARWKKELGAAVIRHYDRWQMAPLGKVVSEYFVSTKGDNIPEFFDDEINNLVTSVKDRIEWLDANLPGTCRTK